MKKVLFILTILTLSIATTKGQDKVKIDSLLQTLPNATDSTKVEVLNGLTNEYLLFNVKEKTQQAEAYLQQSLDISRKLSYTKGLAVGLRNQGRISMLRKDYKNALSDLFQSLAMEEDLNNEIARAMCLKLIGECYEKKETYNRAIQYYTKSHDAYRALKQDKKTVRILIDLAELYLKVDKSDFAEIYATQGLEEAQRFKVKEQIKNAYHVLAKVYKASKQYDQAYDFQEKYSNMKDSLAKEQSLAEIAQLEANHKAQDEDRRAKKKQEQRNNLQYLGISAFFILLFGGLFFVGDVAIPPHMMRRMIFIALFLTFQFLLLLLNPILQDYAGGVALVRLLMNGFFALGFVFLIRYLEKRINMRLEKRIRRRIKKRVAKKLKNTDAGNKKAEKKAKKELAKKELEKKELEKKELEKKTSNKDSKSTNKGMTSEVAAS